MNISTTDHKILSMHSFLFRQNNGYGYGSKFCNLNFKREYVTYIVNIHSEGRSENIIYCSINSLVTYSYPITINNIKLSTHVIITFSNS